MRTRHKYFKDRCLAYGHANSVFPYPHSHLDSLIIIVHYKKMKKVVTSLNFYSIHDRIGLNDPQLSTQNCGGVNRHKKDLNEPFRVCYLCYSGNLIRFM